MSKSERTGRAVESPELRAAKLVAAKLHRHGHVFDDRGICKCGLSEMAYYMVQPTLTGDDLCPRARVNLEPVLSRPPIPKPDVVKPFPGDSLPAARTLGQLIAALALEGFEVRFLPSPLLGRPELADIAVRVIYKGDVYYQVIVSRLSVSESYACPFMYEISRLAELIRRHIADGKAAQAASPDSEGCGCLGAE